MAKKNALQARLEYIPVRVTLGLISLLPRRMAVGLTIAAINMLFSIVGGKWRRIGLKNIEIAFPEKTDDERRRILKGSVEMLGRIIGEMSQFAKVPRDEFASIIEVGIDPAQNDYYEEQVALGRGTILVGCHLGNWELGLVGASAVRKPITFLARPLDNPLIEDLLNGLRSRFGNSAINKNDSVHAAVDVLRAGGTLGVLPDVDMHPRFGVFVPFFGVPACTTMGVAMLAYRTGAMLLPVCTVWIEGRGKYVTKYGKLIEARRGAPRSEEIARITAAFTKATEDFVRASPEQYFWFHRRWKTRPEGEPSLY